ncbi:MAG: cell division protein ZapD, partial [Pseudomonadota bacterium]
MGHAVFEFPLKEKVRNYLRVEQLLGQLKITAKSEHTHLQLVFFEQLFELLDLIERLDLRSDLTKGRIIRAPDQSPVWRLWLP